MNFLISKESYVRLTENQIDELKKMGDDYLRTAKDILDAVADTKVDLDGNPIREYDEVIQWIWNSLTKETKSEQVDSLTEDQANYGLKLVSAIYDCATIGL